MNLSFSYLPELQILARVRDNSQDEAQFRAQVAIFKKWIFEEMTLVYNSSPQTQENVDSIIESLISKVAELSIAGHILDNLVSDYSQMEDLEQLGR